MRNSLGRRKGRERERKRRGGEEKECMSGRCKRNKMAMWVRAKVAKVKEQKRRHEERER